MTEHVADILASFSSTWAPTVPWDLVGLAAVSLGLLAGAGWLWARLRRGNQEWDAFFATCSRLGLTGQERDLLTTLVHVAGLRRPGIIFADAGAFEPAVTALTQTSRVRAMSDEGQRYVGAMLASLREKMGFRPASRGAQRLSSRQIPEGRKVCVSYRGLAEGFDAVVSENCLKELVVEPEMPVDVQPGESCRVRYGDEGRAWEFDVPAVSVSRGKVALRHSEQGRSMNRRRFPRVPSRHEGYLAAFPFTPGAAAPSTPLFSPATLVEIAGPGLRFRTPLEFQPGDRALVVLRLSEGHVVQAMGKVCRTLTGGDGVRSVAIELQTLTGPEEVELAHETYVAARAGGEGDAATKQAHLLAQGSTAGETRADFTGQTVPALSGEGRLA